MPIINMEAPYQLLAEQAPAVHEHEQDHLERRGDHDRWQHHHAHRHERGDTTMSMMMNGMKRSIPILNAVVSSWMTNAGMST